MNCEVPSGSEILKEQKEQKPRLGLSVDGKTDEGSITERISENGELAAGKLGQEGSILRNFKVGGPASVP